MDGSILIPPILGRQMLILWRRNNCSVKLRHRVNCRNLFPHVLSNTTEIVILFCRPPWCAKLPAPLPLLPPICHYFVPADSQEIVFAHVTCFYFFLSLWLFWLSNVSVNRFSTVFQNFDSFNTKYYFKMVAECHNKSFNIL